MEYNTDKISSGIASKYLEMFADLKDKPLRMMEVGYLDGEFLRWFKDHFKNSQVYGVGIYPPGELKDCERTELFQGNQNDTRRLLEIGHSMDALDIIIDDASHRDEETRNCFNCLWQFVKPGGWYIIEDWGAHYQHFQYGDMGKVISNILINKNWLGVSNIEILYTLGHSLACFQKKL